MDGIIIINKPKGCTSHDVVYKIKKITGEKVGHTGTLDPNATGVLPLLIGKGTLISKYLMNHDKKYQAVLKLGEKTDTADGEGNVIETQEITREILTKEKVETVLKELIGKQEQIPPMYSAIKVKGKKLYEYARKGQTVEIAPRTIEIYDMVLDLIENDEITFTVACSKGTYIRSLCETIAEKLGSIGYMKELKRLQVGEFKIEEAIGLEDIEDRNSVEEKLLTMEVLFQEKETIVFDKKKLNLLLNGVKLSIEKEDGIYRIYDEENQFIGLATVEKKRLKRDVIL